MPNVGIFYGSKTGQTKNVAELIQRHLGAACQGIFNIADTPLSHMQHFDVLIIGCPTWDTGQLQEDWDMKFKELDAINFAGKKVAFFGSGDAVGFPGTFQDAVGTLYAKLVGQMGATNIGWWNPAGYQHQASTSIVNGYFAGLAIDENQGELTEGRVAQWVPYIQGQF